MYPSLEIFGLTLPLYGLSISLAIVVTYFVSVYLGRRSVLGEDHTTTLFVGALAGSLLGSKLLHLVIEGKKDILLGGIFLGGVIGVYLVTLILARWKKLPLLESLDMVTPVVTLGPFFGRMGCLFAGCCYGIPDQGPLGFFFKNTSVAYLSLQQTHPDLIDGDHTVGLLPTQLFESLFELAIAVLFIVLLLRKVKPGLVFFLHCVLYSVFRFFIEYIRFDPERGYVINGILSTSQFISVFVLALGIWGLWRHICTGGRRPQKQRAGREV